MALYLGQHLVLALVTVIVVQAASELSYRHGLWVAALIFAPLPWILIWWSVFVERAWCWN